MRMSRLPICIALAVAVVAAPAAAQSEDAAAISYQDAPAPIGRILDAAPPPQASLDPTRSRMALFGRSNLPPIAELAEPELRLAGYRINPRNNAPANGRLVWSNSLSFQALDGSAARPVALPAGTRFIAPSWSPDGRHVAFLRGMETGVELWVADAASATARRLTGAIVNAAFGTSYDWLPDGSAILIRTVPAGRGPAPAGARAPTGPIVQENAGRAAPNRTYQDLLRGPADEAVFEHHFTSQLMLVPIAPGARARAVGAPGLILSASVSPGGRHMLVTRVKRPFSYVVPASLFASETVVADLSGRVVHRVADLPLRDDVPVQFDAVAPGPRAVQWRGDRPETIAWVEAQDGGDPRRDAPVRDRLFTLDAPFTGAPRPLADMADRFAGVMWGRADFALLFTRWWSARRETRIAIDPSREGSARTLLTRNYQDRYNDPGTPVLRPSPSGASLLHFTPDGTGLFLAGAGATREAELPFLARMDIANGEHRILWRSAMPHYEAVVAIADDAGERLVTRRESRTEPPNLFLRPRGDGTAVRLTDFPDPAPELAGVTRELVTYRRADGVDLSGTLFLPPGYVRGRDGPLPLLMWAYPTEFTDAAVAGQVVDQPNRFVRPGGSSPLFLLTQGYAIFDDPKMPIVGRDGAEPNDTYVEQLVASAEAAVEAVVGMGVAERGRIAVGGHSYGAFMTANLLAHSDLFRTGIARSGAYNRTLTPFGFQAEQRTYWEAVDTYTRMSPFTYVRQINEPILLMHGEADDNTGTFPMQTERFYAALKGNGATVRYVVLPAEAHGYRARESVGHALWEMTRWLDLHLKPARPAAGAAGAR
jgi:dipeptidyl aminopeptidase/acylaminoacyl peptidase